MQNGGQFFQKSARMLISVPPGVFSLLIPNLLSDFYKTKWGIQNGGRFVQKPAKMLIKVSL